MNLEGLLAISGKSGLFRLVAQSRGGVIVESLTEKKRFPVSQTGNVSALADIAIYTYGDEVPLPQVYDKIFAKEEGGRSLNPKESSEKELRAYMEEILPDYDADRVYYSDLKKIFNWYNLLHELELLEPSSEESEENKDPEAEASSDSGDSKTNSAKDE